MRAELESWLRSIDQASTVACRDAIRADHAKRMAWRGEGKFKWRDQDAWDKAQDALEDAERRSWDLLKERIAVQRQLWASRAAPMVQGTFNL